MTDAILVEGLTKRFKDVVAVDDISFTVPAGSVFAFLGTNGAGKSTTIGCLTTVLSPDQGNLQVAGHDVAKASEQVRKDIGVVFQNSLLDDKLSVRENLQVRATPYFDNSADIKTRIGELSELIELDEFIDRHYGQLSGGQRRRVDIARALLHNPKLIFLDEPTTGLDPSSRKIVWKSIHDLREHTGLTVFLTTHYMEETEEADLVEIIDHGKIIARGTPEDLRSKYSSSLLTLTTASGTQVITVADATEARKILNEHGDAVLDFEFRHGRMDDVFLNLTGREAGELL